MTQDEIQPRKTLRAGVIVPAILAVLLIGAIIVAVTEFRRADDERPTAAPKATVSTTAKSTTAASTASAAPAPPPPPPSTPTSTTTTAAPAAVIGANCSPAGATGTTDDGTTVYCSTLQSTGATIWSRTQGQVPEPTVTPAPTEAPLPILEENPVRVCMQETGRTRFACREMIRRSNLGMNP